jgi:hypothetical protein
MTPRRAEITITDLAAVARETAELLVTLEYSGRAVRVPAPPEVRSASWALLYWSFRLDAAAR